MELIDPQSLINTLDNINEELLLGKKINADEGLEAARWIAGRQGEKGSYRGMFAPTPIDFERGIRVFTGERLFSASARHIMGQEAARAVRLLGMNDAAIRSIYERAIEWMRGNPEFIIHGTFCCGRCTMAYWRHVWVGDFDGKERFLTNGIASMRKRRSDDGKWRTIPFFYAIYTLLDMDLVPARAELAYARPVMERYLKRSHSSDYSRRKVNILARAMELVS